MIKALWFLCAAAFAVLAARAGACAGWLCDNDICAVNLAMLPIHDLFHWLLYDSYPAAWPLVLGRFIDCCGRSDNALRALGVVVQLAMLAAIIGYHRANGSVPVTTAALWLLTPCVIANCGSLRAWGMGMTTITLAYAALQRCRREQTAWLDWWWLDTACVLAVQTTYYNSVAVFALLAPGIVLWPHLRRRLLLAGFLSAGSLLIYLPIFAQASHHYVNLKVQFGLHDFNKHLVECATDHEIFPTLGWFAIYAMVAWKAANEFKLHRYEFGVLAVLWPTYYGFLWCLHYTTDEWYYLTLMLITCLTLDRMISGMQDIKQIAGWACLLILCQFPHAWVIAGEHQTDAGPIVEMHRREAKAGDLIVLSPWENGMFWEYYYHGPAKVMTVPPMPDQIVTRYDEEADYIAGWQSSGREPDIAQANRAMVETLAAGHRVWLVSNCEWSSCPPVLTLEQMRQVTPNAPNSFYYSTIENALLLQLAHGWTNAYSFIVPHDHLSPMSYTTAAVLEPLSGGANAVRAGGL